MSESMNSRRAARTAVAIVSLAGLVAAPVLSPAVSAQVQAPRPQTVAAAADDGWPRDYQSTEGKVLLYQPQLDAWDGTKFEAHAAVAIDRGSATAGPLYGVIWFSSNTEIDKETRRVTFLDLTVKKVSFPSEATNADRYLAAIQKVVPARTRVISLDRLEAALAEKGLGKPVSGRALQHTPPRIVFAETPTLLVRIDGQPALKPVGSGGIDRVINTRPLILFDKAQNAWFLHLFDGWMTASSLDGPWSVAENTKAADKAMQVVLESTPVDLLDGVGPEAAGDAAPAEPPSLAKGPVPGVMVSTGPTEVIVTEGRPNYVPVNGTKLLYAANTTANVFKHLSDQNLYVLLSGRWYKAPGTDGPWTYVPGAQLPGDFKAIPDDSPKENVKASVPGTAQAQEALIANEIPQTATVRRDQTSLSPIRYDGAPRFEPIDGTPLAYAVNSPTPVIQVDQVTYYACENAVWFVSASANGPWAVADEVPAVIYTIPPSSPVYNVTFVKVYNASAEDVQVGYTPGYYGAVSEDEDDDGDPDVVVYGTGYCYDPWISSYWYPWSCAWGWGYGLAWTPWLGWAWGWGGYWGWNSIGGIGWGWATGPWGGAIAWGPRGWIGSTGNVYNRWANRSVISRHGAAYNRVTGNYWTRDLGVSYNSRTGRIAAGHKASVTNVFNGNSVSAGKGVVYNPNTGNVTRVSGIKGEQAGAAKLGNQVFAGKDGQVYRKTDDGWQEAGRDQARPKEDREQWKDVRENTDRKNRDSIDSLEKERKARDMGEKRSKDYKSYDRSKTVDRGRVSRPSPSVNRGRMGGGRGGGRRGRF